MISKQCACPNLSIGRAFLGPAGRSRERLLRLGFEVEKISIL